MLISENTKNVPELLAPAGNPEKLRAALFYGANAVYLGGDDFNLRAGCDGFNFAELQAGLSLAKEYSAKIYYCLNSFPQEKSLSSISAVIEECAGLGVDAFIIADPGIFRLARRYAPEIPIHVSTQANTTNSESIAFWQDAGATRVNLARELSWRDIKAIRKAVPNMELETFVHGAMCLAISGKCLLSAWLNKRPANEGKCTHPCRFEYSACPSGCGQDEVMEFEERTRPGEAMWKVGRMEPFSAIWSPQDLCLMPFLPWLAGRGVDSLKIEGRMKGAAYVAHVVDAYSTALANLGHADDNPFNPWDYLPELLWTASRPLSSGFFLPGRRANYGKENAPEGIKIPQGKLLAKVLEKVEGSDSAWQIDVCGNWNMEMQVEMMLPGLARPRLEPSSYALENHRGEKNQEVKSGTKAILHVTGSDIKTGAFIRGV